jgi:RIO kinase 2
LGDVIGVGKESVVYQAQGEITLAIKFHRQGQTSFKHVRRLRDHLDDQPNLPWIHSASQAARNEFQVMKKLYASVCIPRPIALSHHALAMEFVSGTQLNKITLSDPEVGLNMILAEVGKAWNKGIVHGDLSEFNIMIAEVGPTLIDWPSAVERTNPRAQELLERDVFNILRFFERKYKITMPMETALSKIKLSAGGLP